MLNPSAEMLNTIGMDAVVQGDFSTGMHCFEQAMSLHPTRAEYHANLGIALIGHASATDAYPTLAARTIEVFQTTLQLDPTLTEMHGYLGTVYGAIGEVNMALDHLLQAPDSFYVIHRRQVYFYEAGRFAESLVASQQAIALRPDDAVARYNHATLLLIHGRLTEGWREFEWRHLKAGSMASFMATTYPTIPEWQGEIVDHLLLMGEMGFGDMLQYSRYIPQFADRCKRLSVFVPESVRGVLRSSFPNIEFCDELGEFDCYTWMMSAGRHFEISDFDHVPSAPYLRIKPNKIWSERLAHLPGLKVGLVWSGRTGHLADARRSLPFATIAQLFDAPCSFVSLQKQSMPREVHGEARYRSSDDVPDLTQYPVYDAAPYLQDWSNTAEAMQALDLIISVDTAAAHLAGALGKPVWLINRWNSCWRWGQTGETTPWYPSMRIFRQPSMGDWNSVIAKMLDEIDATVFLYNR